MLKNIILQIEANARVAAHLAEASTQLLDSNAKLLAQLVAFAQEPSVPELQTSPRKRN
jgi:hypothetical protein